MALKDQEEVKNACERRRQSQGAFLLFFLLFLWLSVERDHDIKLWPTTINTVSHLLLRVMVWLAGWLAGWLVVVC
jgi:hypothetical protein